MLNFLVMYLRSFGYDEPSAKMGAFGAFFLSVTHGFVVRLFKLHEIEKFHHWL